MLEDTFGDIIQKARQGLGWTVAQVARAASLSEDTVTCLEGGARPGAPQSDALAEALGLGGEKLRAIAEDRYHPRPPGPSLIREVDEIKGYIGSYEVKCYLFFDAGTREGILIDTANSPKEVLKRIKDRRISLRTIVLTHCHHDHVGGVDEIREESGAKVGIHAGELALYRAHARREPDFFIDASRKIRVGKLYLQAVETPGHTPGGTTYRSEKLAFVGDALFAGSTGRSMSPEGYRMLLSSVRERVLTLPPESALFPGHGPATTVGEEIVHNPFFR